MSFAAPGFLWGALAAIAVTVLLHLLAWRRPAPTPLPTARFVPEATFRVAARALRPTDLWLLALRALLLALLGVALARPTFDPRPRGQVRVVVADASRAVASPEELRDSVRSVVRDASDDLVIVFDSTARRVAWPPSVLDSLTRGEVRGALSNGMLMAMREALPLRERYERVDLIVVSPFARETVDDAARAIRAMWPDTVRLVRVAARVDSARPPSIEVDAGIDDPVAAAIALMGSANGAASGASTDNVVRVVRGTMTAADSSWGRARDHVLVDWPTSSAARLTSADSSRAVTAVTGTVIGELLRDDARFGAVPDDATVIARWEDGAAAAYERRLGEGCARRVGFEPGPAGDLALTTAFADVLSSVIAPCSGWRDLTIVTDSALELRLPVPGAATRELAALLPATPSPLVSWLLGAAILIAMAELALRRRVRQ